MPPRPLSFRTSLRLASLSIAAAFALGGTACHSGPPRGPGGGREAIHIPVMEASGKFFDGQLAADVRFGRARLPRRPDGPGGGNGGDGPRHEGRGGPRGNMDGSPHSGSRVRAENNPAVQLHLTLTNTGTQLLEIEVLEFSSALGNFVVHPPKTSIAPGQTATFDPMTSRLGIPQGDLPLKVRLRSSEKTDEQTLTLKIISEDDTPPL